MALTGGGRPKVEPDPQVRAKILSAALEIARDDGVRGLGIAQVLDRAQLGTRAFYRHFDSKDQLVAAMFAEMARVEMQRLEAKMAGAEPVRAVAAWIDGRLDLAFDAGLESELRQMSLEAQSQMFASPKLIGPAYAEILGPLVDQINRGAATGLFADVDPTAEALSIQGVVWAHIERQWATGTGARSDIRERVQRFCLRGLGVTSDVIAAVVAEKRPTSKPLTQNKSVKSKQSR